MEKEFLPYELAVKLKELGFNENCLAYFKDDEFKIPNPQEPFRNSEMKSWFASAPLWQQAFDFLLKKYNLYGIIIPTVTMNWTFKTMTVVEGIVEVPPYKHVDGNDYSGVEEARKACLEKLIEIISK